jgi:hypothetical protein
MKTRMDIDGLRQKIRIDMGGDINAAVTFAKDGNGGWIAKETDSDEPDVFWYSFAYTPSAILRDLPRGRNWKIGPWPKFVTLWGGLEDNPK